MTYMMKSQPVSKSTANNSASPDVLAITIPIAVLTFLTVLVLLLFFLYRRKLNFYAQTKPVSNEGPEIRPIELRRPLPRPFCPQDRFELNKDHLHLLDVIGEGAFGKVLKAAYALTTTSGTFLKKTVAVKTLKENASVDDRKMLLLEIDAMKEIGPNRHVVNMIGYCYFDSETPALILEYCPLGDLKNYLRTFRPEGMNDSFDDCYRNVSNEINHSNSGPQELNPQRMLSYARQIAIGMEYLSSQKIVHRDLAARNILVSSPNLVKISDFGLARDIYESNLYLPSTRQKLPYKWMALETLKDLIFTVKSDVWSFGVILWEITSLGSCPYPGCSGIELYNCLEQGYRLSRPDRCDENMYFIMMTCWDADPNLRPDFPSLRHSIEQLMTNGNQYLELESIDQPQSFSTSSGIIITTTCDETLSTPGSETPRLSRSRRNSRTPDGYLIPDSSRFCQDQNSHALMTTQNSNRLTIPLSPRYVMSPPNAWSPSKQDCSDAGQLRVSVPKRNDDEEEAYDSGCGGEGGSSASTSPALLVSPLRDCGLQFRFASPKSLAVPNVSETSNQYLQASPRRD